MKMTSDIVKFFVFPDGNFKTVYFFLSDKKENETEKQFIDRSTDRIKQISPEFLTAKEFTKSKDDMRSIVSSSPKGHRRRTAISQNGTLSIIEDIELPKEKINRLVESIKSKFTKGQPLTEEEASFVLHGR